MRFDWRGCLFLSTRLSFDCVWFPVLVTGVQNQVIATIEKLMEDNVETKGECGAQPEAAPEVVLFEEFFCFCNTDPG